MADLFPNPEIDGYGTATIGQWGGWLLQIMPMIFNDRLVLTPKMAPKVYDYGWCFPKGGAAWLAAAAWDLEAQAEPSGYIKAVRPGRRPGETAHEGLMQDLAILRGILAADPGADRQT